MTIEAVPRITTERLLLREWQASDREPFAGLNADARVAEHLGAPLGRDESDALIDGFIARWATDGYGVWAVERLEDGTFLGFTGLNSAMFEAHFTPAVEIEWRLAPDGMGPRVRDRVGTGGAPVRLRNAEPGRNRVIHRPSERTIARRDGAPRDDPRSARRL